jgi:hypothetical protein
MTQASHLSAREQTEIDAANAHTPTVLGCCLIP